MNIQNKLGDTALIAASYKGHADLVDLLVQHGAQVDIANNAGDTARKLRFSINFLFYYSVHFENEFLRRI